MDHGEAGSVFGVFALLLFCFLYTLDLTFNVGSMMAEFTKAGFINTDA